MAALRAVAQANVDYAFDKPRMGPVRLQAAAASDDPEVRDAVVVGLDALLRAHEALFRQARNRGRSATRIAGLSFIFYLM